MGAWKADLAVHRDGAWSMCPLNCGSGGGGSDGEPLSTVLAVGCGDGSIKHWDLTKSLVVLGIGVAHSGVVRSLLWIAEYGLFSAADDGIVLQWGASQSTSVVQRLQGHTKPVWGLASSAGLLFSGSLDCTVRAWSPTDGACLHLFEQGSMCTALAATDRVLYSACGGSIWVWKLSTKTLVNQFDACTAHARFVHVVDGALVSADVDPSGTHLKKWRLSDFQ